jgi:hypothetical protein
VQELHRCGTPVVVGSQLPLTKPGSVAFTQAFYRPLLEGQDVRGALHAGRVAVRKSDAAGHDWLSIVAYVRLPPEGYAAHLLEFGLRAELGILKALQTEADDLNIGGGTEERFRAAEQLLAERIVALEVRLKKLREEETSLRQECGGLLASAHKRRAELLFTRADKFPAQRDQDLVASREALVRSLEAYRNTFQAFPQSHWNGMQQLALEVALNGRIANPGDWDLVRSFAERVRSSQPKDFWTLGTLVEALFIAPIAGKDRTLDAVQAAIAELRKRAGDKSFAVESTRRQIQRYATWWTHENGFFPGVPDLSADAKTILALLS